MPVLLDTDHLSVLQWQEQPAANHLLARLDQLPPDDIATSIISFHEHVQGWQAYLNRARKPQQIVEGYARLEIIWRSFLKMNVLSFTAAAQACFDDLRRAVDASKRWTCASPRSRLQPAPFSSAATRVTSVRCLG